MAAEDLGRIRNVGLVGQGGVGKTFLADALILAAGATTRLGRVDDGSSLFDFEPEEVRRRTTISSALHHCAWKKHEITVADTPGYSVFQAETRATLAAMTGAVLVLSPHGDVKVELERAWTWCGELGVPAVAFMSKLDREETDLTTALAPVVRALGTKVVPLMLPIGSAGGFSGFVDLVTMKAWTFAGDFAAAKEGAVPSELEASASEYRDRLLEAVAEADDTLLERYLESGELSEEEVRRGLREATLGRKFLPLLVGSAHKGIGVTALLDAI